MAQDPYKYFRIEARELCEQLSQGALELEKGTGGEAHVSRLLRLAHTLKGAARVVKQRQIADLAHGIEDALEPFRHGAQLTSRAPIDLLLANLDTVGALLAALDQPGQASSQSPTPSAASKAEAGSKGAPPISAPAVVSAPMTAQAAASDPRVIEPLVDTLALKAKAVAELPRDKPKATVEELVRTLRADISEVDALMDGIAEAHVSLSSLSRALSGFERIDHVIELLAEQLGMLRNEPVALATTTRSLSILEELRNLLGGLRSSLDAGVAQTDRELRQARAGAELLRLLPAHVLFNVLERTARDAAQSLGKQVTFEARGGDVRLDSHVIEVIQKALVQLVRNAVAHGIELPSERRALGKPERGTVRLEVSRHGGRISFACRDDGRGVDVEAVRSVAQQRGETPVETLNDRALLELLMRGGISTSHAVTEVSGRGVGLDVVRESAARLGGDVDMRTESGKGTTIEIWVAASLTSFDGLFVEAGRQTAVLPLDVVRRTLRVRNDEISYTGDGESITLEGKVIPFMPLSRSLRQTSEGGRARPVWTTIVVEARGALSAVGVDRMLGTENVVLRALPRLAQVAPIIAGTSLDAEGTPQIVLDPAALVAASTQGRAPEVSSTRTRMPILVVDDSLTTRMLEQSILESAGYEVDVASSGEEGLEKARKRRYGLLLVDVEMPGMDGFEVITEVRKDPLLKDMPAILVTSRNAPQDFQRGKEVGANAHIVKGNFDQTDFLRRIQVLME